jgi:hypothetical protein
MSDKPSLVDVLGSIATEVNKSSALYEKECEEWWNSLPQEEQLKAFYSVVKRIHKGDIVDKGSYRYVLYSVFGFGSEAYGIGMDCGYLNLHNAIIKD